MTPAQQHCHRDDDAKCNREMQIFRSCNDKIGKILLWTDKDEGSIEELRELALSKGGLYNACMRQKAWPALLGTQKNDLTLSGKEEHKDIDIIRKDVQRSAMFRSKAVEGSIVKGEQQWEILQKKVISVLEGALSAPDAIGVEDKPCYYQGLHDVAFVLLFNLNYDESAATHVLHKLMQTHLRDAARKDFSNVLFVLDSFLMPLLHSLDLEVYQALVESEVPLTNAVLPWLITLFIHSVQDGAVASCLMDAFIANPHPMLPFYVTVALFLHPALRQQLLAAAYDPVTMHIAIHGLPGQLRSDFAEEEDGVTLVTAQDVISSALDIMRHNPPESLLGFLGVGLKKRTRRRIMAKARAIPMLQTPMKTFSWRASAERFLRNHARAPEELAKEMERHWSSAVAAYNAGMEKGCAVLAVSKESMLALQLVVLFLLMPQHYVQRFYCMVFSVVECLSPDWRKIGRNKKGGKETMLSIENPDEELPDMDNSACDESISETSCETVSV